MATTCCRPGRTGAETGGARLRRSIARTSMGDSPETGRAEVRDAGSREALRYRRLGLVGSATLSVASRWAGALPVYPQRLHWFQPPSATTLVAAAFGYAGLVVLITSWWR